jgi:hypothetical protein
MKTKPEEAKIYASRVLGARHATRTEAGRLAVMVLDLVERLKEAEQEVSDLGWKISLMRQKESSYDR